MRDEGHLHPNGKLLPRLVWEEGLEAIIYEGNSFMRPSSDSAVPAQYNFPTESLKCFSPNCIRTAAQFSDVDKVESITPVHGLSTPGKRGDRQASTATFFMRQPNFERP